MNYVRCTTLVAVLPWLIQSLPVSAADGLKSVTTHREAYGETKGQVAVDPAKDLPRLPPVEPKDALATWQVKEGFRLELAAHEPQVRDPIAVSFDERGRMFVCEMIDYSEGRDQIPHLGRISMLEDKDEDGVYESSKVFADNLAWPTGLIWANGGLYVIATPDVIFFKDHDDDGRADLREVVFTGFGTGLKILNVQGMANCPQWGMDGRIHLQAGGGNRGKIKCLKRPELPEIEIGGRDFWFDPLTNDFGLEAGGGQYGMSFDTYGRKFSCNNSDHLQFVVCDDTYTQRNPYFNFPQVRQSIAVDGGAAEVFRLSPDEPWRIIRTRWRIAGVVKGSVEGGGRVSGYFTGATGTTVYRGDAYGPEFVNNTFTGDAGGQLIHRKQIRQNGASLLGERPADERGREFAASKDTWCRVVNFANAPDGCLYAMDMYRETIEHPWAIPDEIKQHLDLNSGNNRGRLYRIVREGDATWRRRTKVDLSKADLVELVSTLEHANGWHRDCASRLIYERQDKAAFPLLVKLLVETDSPLAKLYALGLLDAMGAAPAGQVLAALRDADEHVREYAIKLSSRLPEEARLSQDIVGQIGRCVVDAAPRVRMQAAFALGRLFQDEAGKAAPEGKRLSVDLAAALLQKEEDAWVTAALMTAPPEMARPVLVKMLEGEISPIAEGHIPMLIRILAAQNRAEDIGWLVDMLSKGASISRLQALAEGLKRAGSSLARADKAGKFNSLFAGASAKAGDSGLPMEARLEAVLLLNLASFDQAQASLHACLAKNQPEPVQLAAIKALGQYAVDDVPGIMLSRWSDLGGSARAAALDELLSRPNRILALLGAMKGTADTPMPGEFSAAQIQMLLKHSDKDVVSLTQKVLASVIPLPRETVVARFQPSLSLKGDSTRGQLVFMQRCFTCHRAGGQGFEVGPDLITVKTKGREALLAAILDPNKEVAPQFISYTLETKDGQTLAGILTKDDTTGVTVRMVAGQEFNVARSQVKKMLAGGISLMPEGLEAGLDPQALADLLEFVETLK